MIQANQLQFAEFVLYLPILKNILASPRGVFRSQSNIYDIAFLRKLFSQKGFILDVWLSSKQVSEFKVLD